MAGLQYINATENDLEKIVEIYNSTISSRMVTADTEPVSIESKVDWFQAHCENFRPLWMVKNGDEVVGWVSFQSFYGRPAYNSTAEISIYLDENQRGKGFGRDILNYCIEKSPELGIRNLLGFIFSHNEPSLKLFMKAGFEVWGELPNVAVMDGVERSLSILGKKIN